MEIDSIKYNKLDLRLDHELLMVGHAGEYFKGNPS